MPISLSVDYANIPVISASATQFAAVWTHDNYQNYVTSVYVNVRNPQGWLVRQSLVEKQDLSAQNPGIILFGGGIRAFWSQPNAANAVDVNAYRIWVSGEL